MLPLAFISQQCQRAAGVLYTTRHVVCQKRQKYILIASEVCYAGAVELFGLHLPHFGIEVSFVDTSDLGQVRAALRPNAKLIYVETPANPILRISDIAALAQIAHTAGVLLAVDSTWARPSLQKPIALGADFALHSLTK
jgi:cystathionine beta-lyase/cystathionine gamma-synthase